MDTKEIQETLKEYDKKFWEQSEKPIPEQIRHITLHMGKLNGKLSDYCERYEHNETPDTSQITAEVIPDLLSYSLRLSYLLGEDPEELYISRLEELSKKFGGKNA